MTGLTWPLRVKIDLPVLKSHILPIPSVPADINKEPSGWKATVVTGCACPSWINIFSLRSISQSLQVWSKLLLAKNSPHGWKSILFTFLGWPSSVWIGLELKNIQN